MPNIEGRQRRVRTRVLILAGDPMVAALVGLLLDPESYDPVFPLPSERPEDALGRVRPPLVLVVDCGLEAARSDLFYARTVKTRAAVVLFGAPGPVEPDAASIAAARGFPFVRLPTDRATLTRALESGINTAVTNGVWGIAAAVVAGMYRVARLTAVMT